GRTDRGVGHVERGGGGGRERVRAGRGDRAAAGRGEGGVRPRGQRQATGEGDRAVVVLVQEDAETAGCSDGATQGDGPDRARGTVDHPQRAAGADGDRAVVRERAGAAADVDGGGGRVADRGSGADRDRST